MIKKTFRPAYMTDAPIVVFHSARIDATTIFSIPLGEQVEVIEENVIAWDNILDRPHKTMIKMSKIMYDGKVGFVNSRWLK